ncbi:JmjC domain-containing histone demethylation protein 1 [Podila clonocystis]|nr:JmjC domain-containing histone demethylation protein 1 [Podila clonocystis]
MADEEERCCLCPKNKAAAKGTWICCDICQTWYHMKCLGMSLSEFDIIDNYHCPTCEPKAGPSTLKRKSSRKSGKINYADLVNGIVSHEDKWRVQLDSYQFMPDKFERVSGKDVTMQWLRMTGFKSPVIIPKDSDSTTDGLGMKMPPSTLTVDDVRDAVGPDTPVEVIDVATQSEQANWNMASWAEYFRTEPKERVYNVISLEITGTPLADRVTRPTIVRELDWIENFWPEELRKKEFPKVQLYCLMSVKNSFTDFHIDFAGSSVFYHILSGSKTFYFVEPTSTNLRKYSKWSSSSSQSTTFFGDEVPGKCYKVELQQGDTMLIPAGWIHSVYTPETSVVIGGNFIHSLHIPMQYKVANIEIDTNVPPKFRFPYFEKLNWFVAHGSLTRGQGYLSSLSSIELRGLMALTKHLYDRQWSLKHDPNLIKEEKFMIKASIPTEASSYADGGCLGLLRHLSQMAGQILESRQDTIEDSLRLPTSEKGKKKSKPLIKLRIKLGTPSATNSGDEGSTTHGGLSKSAKRSTTTSAETTPVSDGPKLKLKISDISKNSSTKTSPTGSRHDDGDTTLGEDDFSESNSEAGDLHLHPSDDEWNELENDIDEGFGELNDDDLDDDGAVEPGSSDSEYDEVASRPRKRSRSKKDGSPALSLTPIRSASTTPPILSRPRSKLSSSETVYFGDDDVVEDEIKSDVEKSEEAAFAPVLGMKRKPGRLSHKDIGPKGIGIGLPMARSVSSSSLNSAGSLGTPKKKAVPVGSTPKDRLRNLLLKRR